MKAINLAVLAALVALAMTFDYEIACNDQWEQENYEYQQLNFTDSAVGCTDDCLTTQGDTK